jgi:hypothetical protein
MFKPVSQEAKHKLIAFWLFRHEKSTMGIKGLEGPKVVRRKPNYLETTMFPLTLRCFIQFLLCSQLDRRDRESNKP